jgi:hypothetical protein
VFDDVEPLGRLKELKLQNGPSSLLHSPTCAARRLIHLPAPLVEKLPSIRGGSRISARTSERAPMLECARVMHVVY